MKLELYYTKKGDKAEFSNTGTKSPNHFRVVKTFNIYSPKYKNGIRQPVISNPITLAQANTALKKWNPQFSVDEGCLWPHA